MAPSDRPKLTYLITGLQYGGANIGMVRLLSGLHPDEFDITVVSVVKTSDDVVDMVPDHVSVHQLNLSSLSETYRLPKLIPLLRGTDILVCSLFHASVVGTLLGHILRIPSILVWQHNTKPANQLRFGLYHLVYRAADRVLADSERVKTMLQTEYEVPNSKISVLPIAGIDTKSFRPFDIDTTEAEVAIGTVGRLTPEKGFDDLLRCARRLGPPFQFYIAGDGPEREWLEANAPENVTIRGKIPNEDIPEFLNRVDAYFQPSKREGLCMTVIEAMACGLPVVGSRVGGITESVVHGETGYLCAAGDIDCFCRHLKTLASDRGRRRKMGSAGRERVAARYSKSVLADAFREAVEQTETV